MADDNTNLLTNTGLWNASKLFSRNATYQNVTISTAKYINFNTRVLAVNRTDLCNNTSETNCGLGKSLVSRIGEYLLSELKSTHVEGENKSSGIVMFKVMSQVREGDAGASTNGSASDVKQTMKSSLGSVAVVVPSLARTEPHSAHGGAGPGRNRTGGALRAGRTDAPMLNYIFDAYSTLNKHSHRNDRWDTLFTNCILSYLTNSPLFHRRRFGSTPTVIETLDS